MTETSTVRLTAAERYTAMIAREAAYDDAKRAAQAARAERRAQT
jgi:hypothetical protein